MKKFLSIVLITLIFALLPTDVAAAEAVYCTFDSDSDIKLNKGFNIYLNMNCNADVKLSALRVDITFDNSTLKFMSAESDESGATLNWALVNDNTVRLVYINDTGLTLSSQGSLVFSIRFKPITSPENMVYDFSAKIFEAADSNADYLLTESGLDFTVTNDGTVNVIANEYDESRSVDAHSGGSTDDRKSRSGTSFDTSEPSADEDSEMLDSSDDNNGNSLMIGDDSNLDFGSGFSYLMYGFFAAFIIAAAIFAVHKLVKDRKNKK